MALIKRLDIGRPITAAEMDANLQYLEDSISAGTSGVSGTSGTSGVSGSPGISGSSGSSGTSGASGSTGASGSSGSSGTRGTAGSGGTSGSSGTTGTAGSGGSSGTSGAGTSGTSGTSISLSIFDGTTRVSGVQRITLTGLNISPSGSGGAELVNFGGGGGGSTINVASGSTTISSVSTVRVDPSNMSLINNGAGTVTIGVLANTGSAPISGVVSSSNQITNFGFISSSLLTIQKGETRISGIQSLTLTGSIFLDSSGSNGAFLRVNPFDTSTVLAGVVSSSQQIAAYDVFPVKNAENIFTQINIFSASVDMRDTPAFGLTQGHIIVGGPSNRSLVIPTSSLGVSGGSAGVSVINQGLNITFTGKTKLSFTSDFGIFDSGSDGVVISSLITTSSSSGDGFPYTGSAGISGSLSITNDLSVGGFLTASAFAISSVGVPEIASATNINLTAGNAVVITSSSLRLSTFTDAQTGSITAQNGDMIYNSTTHKFMGYASGSWVQLH